MKKIILLALLFPLSSLADGSVGKREIGLILQSGHGKPKIESNYNISQERGFQYGLAVGYRDLFKIGGDVPVGIWGSSILNEGFNFQLGVSVEPVEDIQLRVGGGMGTEKYDYDSVDSSGQYLNVRRVYGFQVSTGVNYFYNETFTIGGHVNSRLEVGVVLGLRF